MEAQRHMSTVTVWSELRQHSKLSRPCNKYKKKKNAKFNILAPSIGKNSQLSLRSQVIQNPYGKNCQVLARRGQYLVL